MEQKETSEQDDDPVNPMTLKDKFGTLEMNVGMGGSRTSKRDFDQANQVSLCYLKDEYRKQVLSEGNKREGLLRFSKKFPGQVEQKWVKYL